jgi:hypothetical protein
MAAGAVAGKMTGGSNFFEVHDIHDLFEIGSAIATIVGATVAIVALGSWRHQFMFAEKYKAVRAFSAACKNCMNSYHFVAWAYSSLEDVWLNRNEDEWFEKEHKLRMLAMSQSNEVLDDAFMNLHQFLPNEDLNGVDEWYGRYKDEVSYGCSELISFSSECSIMISEPTDKYDSFSSAGQNRCRSLLEAITELQIKGNELVMKYATS